jgi:hypothetical protein
VDYIITTSSEQLDEVIGNTGRTEFWRSTSHAEEKSLAIYRDLALSDVAEEYEEAMRAFRVR